MALYELAILGAPTPDERQALEAALDAVVSEFGFTLGDEVALRDAHSLAARDPLAALAACFFVTDPCDGMEVEAADRVVAARAPIIPTIAHGGSFDHVPPSFASANGLRRRSDDPAQSELAAALLECVGLIRAQRRVFVSYRRIESREAALQLHELLSGRGFDVFLDTHDIRPGAPFQEMLWHRLCDTDVLVMLDTPGYFDSRWTRQEIARARAKELQVLRVIWPDHTPTRLTEMADTFPLEASDLHGAGGPLDAAVAEALALRIETLRSRSLAARHRSMAGRLSAEAQKVGGAVEGIGAHRAINIRLLNGKRVRAYPVIGVPTSDLLHEIAEKSAAIDGDSLTALVYDEIGLIERWCDHLQWLERKIKEVVWIKVTKAGWTLAGLDDGEA